MRRPNFGRCGRYFTGGIDSCSCSQAGTASDGGGGEDTEDFYHRGTA